MAAFLPHSLAQFALPLHHGPCLTLILLPSSPFRLFFSIAGPSCVRNDGKHTIDVATENMHPDPILCTTARPFLLFPSSSAPAPTPAATTTTPATPANPTTASTPARAPEPAARPATTPATPASPTAPAAPTGPTNNTTLSAQEFSDAVQNIVDMGFDRNDAQRALNAAYGDSARAVEYIVSGNIPNVNNGPAAGGARAPPPVAAAAGAPAGNPNSPFAQLRQLPQFQGIIALIQQNPALLEPLLQQLAQRDPNIVELIRENREEFLQILQQPVDPNVLGMLQAAAEEEGEEFGEEDEDDIAAQLSAAGALGGNPGAATGAQGGMPRAPPGSTVIQITPQEKEAIDRLVALGFDRNRAIEAFLVCNKDEEMAANYLLEQGFD